MKTIPLEVPDEMALLGRGTNEQLAATMHLATTVLWYRQGRIPQSR